MLLALAIRVYSVLARVGGSGTRTRRGQESKPEARLRLYVGGRGEARLDFAAIMRRMTRWVQTTSKKLGVESSLASTPNVDPKLCLRVASPLPRETYEIYGTRWDKDVSIAHVTGATH